MCGSFTGHLHQEKDSFSTDWTERGIRAERFFLRELELKLILQRS